MVTRGRNIQLFLMDGDSSGRMKCTLANWTGVAYKIPRTMLEKCKGREDLSQSGVYFLFGISDETGDSVVYIGQADVRKNGEGILYRLQEHKRDERKDYWTEAVVFTTSNNSFGPTEISYLEHRFTNIAVEAKRYVIKNGNEPASGGTPTEEKESELEEFIEYTSIVMGTLGHKIFEPLTKTKPLVNINDDATDNNDSILSLKRKSRKSGQTIEATTKQVADGFVVLKGSQMELNDSESIPPGIKEARQKAKVDENGILLENVHFKSPSYAAAFIVGGHVNGLTSWKNAEGRTLKELEDSED